MKRDALTHKIMKGDATIFMLTTSSSLLKNKCVPVFHPYSAALKCFSRVDKQGATGHINRQVGHAEQDSARNIVRYTDAP